MIQHKEVPTEMRETMIQFFGHLAEPEEVTIHPDVLRASIGLYFFHLIAKLNAELRIVL